MVAVRVFIDRSHWFMANLEDQAYRVAPYADHSLFRGGSMFCHGIRVGLGECIAALVGTGADRCIFISCARHLSTLATLKTSAILHAFVFALLGV